ncbi:hypothetical protein VTO42DRAFT_7069 [Malbranchea cinnamomea]
MVTHKLIITAVRRLCTRSIIIRLERSACPDYNRTRTIEECQEQSAHLNALSLVEFLQFHVNKLPALVMVHNPNLRLVVA